jgi:hypothetical protein
MSIFDDMKKDNEEVGGVKGLLGNLIIPGSAGNLSNKDLINAAILRGSLELLKPKQPGENLASQFGRGLTAASETATSLQGDVDSMLKKIELEEKLTERQQAKVRKEGQTDFPQIEYSRDQQDIDKNIASAFGLADSAKELYASQFRKVGVEFHEEGRKGKVGYGAMRPLLLRYAAGQVAGRPAVYYFQLSEQELPVQGEDNLTARQKFQELERKFSDGISALKKEYAQAERPIRREKLMQEIKQAEYIKRRLSVVDYGFRLENDTETGVDSRATTELSDEVDTIYDITPEQFLGS